VGVNRFTREVASGDSSAHIPGSPTVNRPLQNQWTPLNSLPTSTLSARASFTIFSIPTFRFPHSIPLHVV